MALFKTLCAVAVAVAGVLVWRTQGTLNDLSLYDHAPWWDPASPYNLLLRMNEVRVPYILRFLPPAEQLLIMDAGCGGGFVAEALATQGHRVVGVDLSVAALEAARAHAALVALPHLQYVQGSIYALPAESGSLDVVVACDVFEHLIDVPAALREIARVLRPGGVLVFDTIAKTLWSFLGPFLVAQELLGIVERGAHDWRMFIAPERLESMLREAQLVPERISWAGIGARLAPLRAVRLWSRFELIESFYEDFADLSANYMGIARKPEQ